MHDSLKYFVMKKSGIFSTLTQILESVFEPGHSILSRGATIRQKVYCDILQYGKPVLRYILRYTWYLYFCLSLALVQNCSIIQGS